MIINGKILKKALKDADLTQEEAAKRLNVARQTVNTWVKSDFLNLAAIENVKTNLGIDLDKVGKLLNEPDIDYKASEPHQVGVPIYNVDFTDRNFKNPVGFLDIPEVSGCDAIIRARGNSMSPRINDGDWLGVKRQDNWEKWLPMNYIYAIDANDLQIVRYLKKGSKSDTFTIISENKDFEDDEIPKKLIKEIWSVKTILPFGKIETIM